MRLLGDTKLAWGPLRVDAVNILPGNDRKGLPVDVFRIGNEIIESGRILMGQSQVVRFLKNFTWARDAGIYCEGLREEELPKSPGY